ncbi:MAG: phosphotransferase family protein [Actinomycetota bacterium]|nr:phosphotransferase family protein [Actinomycetota bacterium]
MAEDIRAGLQDWLGEEVGQPVAIGGLRRTSAGFSRENWVLDATWNGTRHDLIVRRDPVGSVLNTDRRVEVAVLRGLEPTAVKAPRLRWADLDGTRLGRPSLVMDLVRGTCDGFVLNGERTLGERVALAHALYDQLAAIHQVDLARVGLPGVAPGNAARAAVDHWESELRAVQLEAEPELTFVFTWLRANAPVNERTALVHGDFKPGNALFDDDGEGGTEWTAILDWETAHLGDPHEDLGWVTNPLRQREHRIPGGWEPDDLLDRWSARTGWDVDRDAVHWWQVLANAKLAVIVHTGARAFVQGKLDRIHQAPVRIHQLLLQQIGA